MSDEELFLAEMEAAKKFSLSSLGWLPSPEFWRRFGQGARLLATKKYQDLWLLHLLYGTKITETIGRNMCQEISELMEHKNKEESILSLQKRSFMNENTVGALAEARLKLYS